MLTARGWAVLGSGVVLFALARGLGATVLGVLGIALVVLPLVAVALCRRHRRGDGEVVVEVRPRRPVEGAAWSAVITARGRVPAGAQIDVPVLGTTHAVRLRRGSAVVRGVAARRGRYPALPGRLRIADPLGLAGVARPIATTGDAVVWLAPAAAEVAAGAGPGGDGSRRAAAARAAGFDLHGIREHRPGESLRRVDWRTSARTGALMVREVDDAARADVLLVVDPGDRDHAAPPEQIDALLRTAAALAWTLHRSDRAAVLAVEGARRQRVDLDGSAPAWDRAMDALSGAEPDRDGPLAERLARCRDAAAATAMVVVSATPDRRLAAWIASAERRCEIAVIGPDGAAAPARSATAKAGA